MSAGERAEIKKIVDRINGVQLGDSFIGIKQIFDSPGSLYVAAIC